MFPPRNNSPALPVETGRRWFAVAKGIWLSNRGVFPLREAARAPCSMSCRLSLLHHYSMCSLARLARDVNGTWPGGASAWRHGTPPRAWKEGNSLFKASSRHCNHCSRHLNAHSYFYLLINIWLAPCWKEEGTAPPPPSTIHFLQREKPDVDYKFPNRGAIDEMGGFRVSLIILLRDESEVEDLVTIVEIYLNAIGIFNALCCVKRT